ncbi:MAG: hypothetical protein LBI13_07860 [Streptococcaceae bacterium]|nr:hypothetical protein [Streptococcaceae bacterium]
MEVKKRIRKDQTHYLVSSNFGGSKAEIRQLLVVLEQVIKSREALNSKEV